MTSETSRLDRINHGLFFFLAANIFNIFLAIPVGHTLPKFIFSVGYIWESIKNFCKTQAYIIYRQIFIYFCGHKTLIKDSYLYLVNGSS